MEKLRYMVVSGFLGAGKTTTMIALAEYMDEHHGKTGIIANDMGANLVDTELTQLSGCTVTEIGNDCICYQMDNVVDRLRRLRDKDGCVFVMSDIPGCGVGALDHVYGTLDSENSDEFELAPFMVMVDPERLRMIMPEKADIHLPEELIYLMQLQLEEADLIVLNKIDLLDDETRERYLAFLCEACPETPVMSISARTHEGIPALADYLLANGAQMKDFNVRNNQKFEDAEAVLTWYNRRLYFKTKDGGAIDCNAVVDDVIEGIRMGLIERKRNVPHLKIFATSTESNGEGEDPTSDFCKASLIGIDYDTEYAVQFEHPHANLRMIINARAVCESRPMARLVDDAVDEVCEAHGLDCQVFFTECFGILDEGR